MDSRKDYSPPKIWKWKEPSGGAFANINKPTSGATYEANLPVGKHPLQLYSQGTPNGVKVTIMLEELLALGYTEAEYDAWLCKIAKGEQFSTGFVKANPNSKIPVLIVTNLMQKKKALALGNLYVDRCLEGTNLDEVKKKLQEGDEKRPSGVDPTVRSYSHITVKRNSQEKHRL